MLRAKHCHAGLRATPGFLGLEVTDGLLLFPGFYLVAAIFGQFFLAVAITVLGAVVLRVLKWRRLGGHTEALVTFMMLRREHVAFERDRVPAYPSAHLLSGPVR